MGQSRKPGQVRPRVSERAPAQLRLCVGLQPGCASPVLSGEEDDTGRDRGCLRVMENQTRDEEPGRHYLYSYSNASTSDPRTADSAGPIAAIKAAASMMGASHSAMPYGYS